MRENIERNKQIVQLRDAGVSFGLLADKFGIAKPTIHRIYTRRKQRYGKQPFRGLPLSRKGALQKLEKSEKK